MNGNFQDGEEVATERVEQKNTWLLQTLKRNRNTAYLKQFGSPETVAAFRERVPVCVYEELLPWLARIQAGEADILFAGCPVAYERTGGSTGGVKLIPYTDEGLSDFQNDIVPWLIDTLQTHHITGRVYFSISPATRPIAFNNGIPVGLPDAAYLGEIAGSMLTVMTAVPLDVANLSDVTQWRQRTLAYLKAASDLELISVWSPTFLLRLLDEIPDPQACWPRLKIVSCWASASSRRFADEVQRRLPHARLQPKGLLSTEAVVTVPDREGRPLPARHVFIEYAKDGRFFLEDALQMGETYEAIVTTASGLYRYRTGDWLRCEGHTKQGRPILEFVGRGALTCDLVGEKLNESFVARCLQALSALPVSSMLLPDADRPGYVLICTRVPDEVVLAELEALLCTNPQYAYARRLGQLAPLRVLTHPEPFRVVERTMLARGARLGDIKPLALRREAFWLPLFKSFCP